MNTLSDIIALGDSAAAAGQPLLDNWAPARGCLHLFGHACGGLDQVEVQDFDTRFPETFSQLAPETQDRFLNASAYEKARRVISRLLALLSAKGWWRPLWRDWLTSLDHKKIGIMYIVLALVMFARALAEAVVMRAQQAAAVGDPGFLSGEHFGQLFSTHGSIMIFFMAMPFLTGLINYVMPIQIGARVRAFRS